jgi:predicted metal-dependent peptidase
MAESRATIKQEKAKEAIAKAGVELLRKEPFFAHILSNLSRRFGDSVDTMAVSCNENGFCLWINDVFVLNKINAKERIAVLKHEILHIILQHIFRGPKIDPFLENIAADLVVNQYVSPWPLPKDAVLLSNFPELNLEPDKNMEWYLSKLKRLQVHDASNKYPQSSKALNELKESNKSRGQHNLWGIDDYEKNNKNNNTNSIEINNSANQATLKNIINEAKLKIKNEQWGNIPEFLRLSIDKFNEKPTLNWKKLIRIFCQSCGKTKIVYTRNKESIRYPGSPGIRIKRLQHVAVAIDTSGSIDLETLNIFWSEIIGISRTGAKITIIECDAKIQKIWEYNKKNNAPNLKGGGGTNFDPVFEWLNQNRNSGIGGCIYLTDGYAAKPVLKPFCPILWVLVNGKKDHQNLIPGKIIEIT